MNWEQYPQQDTSTDVRSVPTANSGNRVPLSLIVNISALLPPYHGTPRRHVNQLPRLHSFTAHSVNCTQFSALLLAIYATTVTETVTSLEREISPTLLHEAALSVRGSGISVASSFLSVAVSHARTHVGPLSGTLPIRRAAGMTFFPICLFQHGARK
jgi:hypothetical protein